MLYIPMPEEVQNYEWSAGNCYSWTPWLDLVVDLIESAKCVDLGLMSQPDLTQYVTSSDQKRSIDASIRSKLTPEELEHYDLTQRWLNR